MCSRLVFFLKILCKQSIVFFIRCYQHLLSPLFGTCCRFYPSCSVYALEAMQSYPVHKAVGKIVIRLLKCHPFHPGGVDLP